MCDLLSQELDCSDGDSRIRSATQILIKMRTGKKACLGVGVEKKT